MNTLNRLEPSSQISNLQFEIPAGLDGSTRRKPSYIAFDRGRFRLPYLEYRRGRYRYFTLFYHADGKRVRESRSTFAALKARAEEVHKRIANGETQMLGLRQADKAAYLRALEIINPTGETLELVCSKYADLVARAKAAGITLEDALKFAIENKPAAFQPRTVPELVRDFLADKKAEAGARWYRSLEQHLEAFALIHTAPMHQVTSAHLNTFLRNLGAGGTSSASPTHRPSSASPRTRHNYRAAIEQLARWAQSNGYLPKTWTELDQVPDPGAKFDGEIKILTPEQLTKLLHARSTSESDAGKADKTFIPFLALAAFAGIRHEELVSIDGQPALDWRDIDLDHGRIYVPKAVAKTCDRIVPITDNLAAWLSPHAKRNGPICELGNTSSALNRLKVRAGLPHGRNATRNTLRKSFISYRLAIVKNIGQVAEEAGNSPAKIKSNYRRPIPETEAKRWFAIYPTAAEVLQLQFF